MTTPVNGPLNAAIAALNAQPYPWFAPAYSIRLTDFSVYTSLVTTYGFGTNIIMGLSPDQAAVLTGVPIVQDPSTAGQAQRPEIFVHPDAQNVLGVPITLAETGGTIFISYASPFGRVDRVVWQWQCEVTYDPAVVAGPVSGEWNQAVFTYIGTGVNGTLVPTPFSIDPTTCTACVWVFPQATFQPSFRHSGMSNGSVMASSALVPGSGITAFGSGGFLVTDNNGQQINVNQLSSHYTAVVIADSTSNNRYLRVGDYAGNAVGGVGTQAIVIPGTFAPTLLWVFGRASVCAFCDDLFVAPNSVSVELEAKSLTNQITAIGNTFTVGGDNNVNDHNLHYYWAAFQIPGGDPVRQMFQTYKITGTGSVVQVTGLGFTPAIAIARNFVAGIPAACFRTPWNLGTDSLDFNLVAHVSGYLQAFGAGTIDIGATAAPNTQDVYGFALAASGTVNLVTGPGPAYAPDPTGYLPSGGLISQGLGTGQLGPCGCPLEMP